MKSLRRGALLPIALLGLSASGVPADVPAGRQPASPSTSPRVLHEGETIPWREIASIAALFPTAVADHAEALFAGIPHLVVGPSFRDYGPPEAYRAASTRSRATGRIGADERLEGHRAGLPFAPTDLDCLRDSTAGRKLAWNLLLAWEGNGWRGRFRIIHEEDGEALADPLEATWKKIWLSNRVEPTYLEGHAGALFRGERRLFGFVLAIESTDDRGMSVLHFRFRDPFSTSFGIAYSQTWAFVPTPRRVRAYPSRFLSRALPDTPIVLENLPDFPLLLNAHRFRCKPPAVRLAPFAQRGAPGERPGNESTPWPEPAIRFEARRVITLEAEPSEPGAAYARRTFHLDVETMRPPYRVDRDADGDVIRVGAIVHGWSEDTPEADLGWAEVPELRSLLPVRALTVHTETGSRQRIDFAELQAKPFPTAGKTRRSLDPFGWMRCVAEGTLVATPSGPRAIETLREGDAVVSYDIDRQHVIPSRVAEIHVSSANATLRFEGGLRATVDHPLYADGAWVEAGHVTPSMLLLTPDGSRVRAGRPLRIEGPVTVYDLTIDGPANFFAGGRLVHNKSR